MSDDREKELARQRMARKRARWIAAGKCPRCGRARLDESFVNCEICRLRDAARQKAKADANGAAGLCKSCGRLPPVAGHTTCELCRPIRAKASSRYANSLRERATTPGFCTRCGREFEFDPEQPKLRRCKLCRDTKATRVYRYLARAYTEGLCVSCPTPATPGYRTCSRCRERNRLSAAARRAAKTGAL